MPSVLDMQRECELKCFKALEIENLDDRMPVSKWLLCRVEIESVAVVKTTLFPLMNEVRMTQPNVADQRSGFCTVLELSKVHLA